MLEGNESEKLNNLENQDRGKQEERLPHKMNDEEFNKWYLDMQKANLISFISFRDRDQQALDEAKIELSKREERIKLLKEEIENKIELGLTEEREKLVAHLLKMENEFDVDAYLDFINSLKKSINDSNERIQRISSSIELGE